jgi:hypothetical protein
MDPTDSGKWSFDARGLGRSAQGFASLTGGAVSGVVMGSFLSTNNSGACVRHRGPGAAIVMGR